MTTKQKIRNAMAVKIQQQKPDYVLSGSLAVQNALQDLVDVWNPGVLIGFVPRRDEPDITPILHQHPKPYLVRMQPDKLLDIVPWSSALTLMTHTQGCIVSEPSPREPGLRPQNLPGKTSIMVLVPGLAFGHAGERLGRGKGYYDRFLWELDQMKSSRDILKVGLCYPLQRLDTVPIDEHDQRVDVVIDGGLWWVR